MQVTTKQTLYLGSVMAVLAIGAVIFANLISPQYGSLKPLSSLADTSACSDAEIQEGTLSANIDDTFAQPNVNADSKLSYGALLDFINASNAAKSDCGLNSNSGVTFRFEYFIGASLIKSENKPAQSNPNGTLSVSSSNYSLNDLNHGQVALSDPANLVFKVTLIHAGNVVAGISAQQDTSIRLTSASTTSGGTGTGGTGSGTGGSGGGGIGGSGGSGGGIDTGTGNGSGSPAGTGCCGSSSNPTSASVDTSVCTGSFQVVNNICVPKDTTGRSSSIGSLIAGIIKLLLTMAGIIALILVIIGGYQYMTSMGNEEQAGRGRKTITYALIGLAIIILSYAIVSIVVRVATTGNIN